MTSGTITDGVPLPLDSVWYCHKAVSLRREIIGIARCEFQFVIFRNCGLKCIRHLPAILPPQGSCEIGYSAVNDQGRKSIQQTAGELPFFTLKTREDLLNSFEMLPEAEKRELASEITKRSLAFDMPQLSDDSLLLAADEIFLQLDRDESLHE